MRQLKIFSMAPCKKCIDLTSELRDTKNIERKAGNHKILGIICTGQKRIIRDLESELKSKETKVTGNINNTFISILATWF